MYESEFLGITTLERPNIKNYFLIFKGESRLWLRQKSADDININIYYGIYVNDLKYNIIVVISNCIITFNYALYYMNIKTQR